MFMPEDSILFLLLLAGRNVNYEFIFHLVVGSSLPCGVSSFLFTILVPASVIVSPCLSFSLLVNVVFSRPADRFPNTIPVNTPFSTHLRLSLCICVSLLAP